MFKMLQTHGAFQLLLLQAILTTGIIAQEIKWGPCQINGTTPLECGNFSVPLDYSDPNSTETLILELIKSPASKPPSKGPLLINFGGPGASGQELMGTLGSVMQATTGGYYDLISFDPRGAGKTLPLSCYKNETERREASLRNPNVNGNASDTTVGRLWASGKIFADDCYTNGKDVGELIGFAYCARDYMRVVDALEEDGLLRYYGLSGGTVLGATIAAMFPDRIDRMVLDGVWNIHEYYHSAGAVEGFTSTDAVLTGFLTACLAADPPTCPLASLNPSAPALETAIYELITTLKYHPLPGPGRLLIDYTLLRNALFLALTSVASWPPLATLLHALLTGDTAAAAAALPALQLAEDVHDTEHRFGIQCGDKFPRAELVEAVLPTVEALGAVSRLAGDRIVYDVASCAQWRFAAKERYAGDFRVRTRHPPLIVGNTWDGVTPLVSARNASASLEGSVVLEQRGYGHCSPSQFSRCTARTVQGYLVNGTVPARGTVCEVDVRPFTNETFADFVS